MQQGTVVVIGTVNLDLVFAVDRLPVANETVAGARYAELGGGKGANVAAAAATRARTFLLAAVGDDAAGKAAIAELEHLGVQCDHIAVVPGVPTGRAGILTGSDGNIIAVAPGANAALPLAALRSSVAAIAEQHPAAVCLVSGELDDASLLTAVEIASEAGWQVLVNLSPARRLPDRGSAPACGLVVNELEARQLTGEHERARLVSKLLDTTEVAVVTLGADGVVAGRRGHAPVHHDADPTRVVDSVGAGDAFFGVLGASLTGSADLETAIAAGAQAAAQAVAAVGARGWLERTS